MTDEKEREMLLYCPFCGGEASSNGKVNHHNSSRKKEHQNTFWKDGTPVDEAFFCNCIECGVTNKGIVGHRTREEAIAAWNRRAPAEQKPKGYLVEWYNGRCYSYFPQEKIAAVQKAYKEGDGFKDVTIVPLFPAPPKEEG